MPEFEVYALEFTPDKPTKVGREGRMERERENRKSRRKVKHVINIRPKVMYTHSKKLIQHCAMLKMLFSMLENLIIWTQTFQQGDGRNLPVFMNSILDTSFECLFKWSLMDVGGLQISFLFCCAMFIDFSTHFLCWSLWWLYPCGKKSFWQFEGAILKNVAKNLLKVWITAFSWVQYLLTSVYYCLKNMLQEWM